MEKIIFIICFFNSLFIYSQIDTNIIDNVKGLSEYEESEIKVYKKHSDEKFTLIYETIDVDILHTKDSIKLKAFKVYPDLKKETKIKQVIIFNSDEKEVFIQNFDSTEAKINILGLLIGTYSIHIQTDNGQINKKFIKK